MASTAELYRGESEGHASSSQASLASTAEFQARHGGCCVGRLRCRQTPPTLLALCLCKRSTPQRPSQASGGAPTPTYTTAIISSQSMQLPVLAAASFSQLAAAHTTPEHHQQQHTSSPPCVSSHSFGNSSSLTPSPYQHSTVRIRHATTSHDSCRTRAPHPQHIMQQQQQQSRASCSSTPGASTNMLSAQHAAQHTVLQAIYDTTTDYDRVSAGGPCSSSSGSAALFDPSFGARNSSTDTSSSDSSSSDSSSEGSVDPPSSSIFELLFAHAGAAAGAAAWGPAVADGSSSASELVQPLLPQQDSAEASSSNIVHGLAHAPSRTAPTHSTTTATSAAAARPAAVAGAVPGSRLLGAAHPQGTTAGTASQAALALRIEPQPRSTPAAMQAVPVLAGPESQLLAMRLLSEVCRASTAFASSNSSTSADSNSLAGSSLLQAGSSSSCHGLTVTAADNSVGYGSSGSAMFPVARPALGMHAVRAAASAVTRGSSSDAAASGRSSCSGGSNCCAGSIGGSGSSGTATVDPVLLQLLTALGLSSLEGTPQQQQQEQQPQALPEVLRAQTALQAQWQQQEQQEQQRQLWYQHLAELTGMCAGSSSDSSTTYYTCSSVWGSDAANTPAVAAAGTAGGGGGGRGVAAPAAAAAAAAAGALSAQLVSNPPSSSVAMPRQHSGVSLGWGNTSGDNVLLGSPALSPTSNRAVAAPTTNRGAPTAAAAFAASTAAPQQGADTAAGTASAGVHAPCSFATVWDSIMAERVPHTAAPVASQQQLPVLPQQLQQQQEVPVLPPPWSYSPPQQQQQAVHVHPRHRLQSAEAAIPRTGSSSSSSMWPIQAAELALAALSPSITAAAPVAAGAAGDSRGGGGSWGVQGSSSDSSGGVGDVGCMLGGAQLSSMSIGELRELLGRVAGLSLAQLQQEVQQG